MKVIPASLLKTMAMHIMKKDNKKGGAYYANYASQYPIKRWTVPIAAFGSGCKAKSEDREYVIPSDYTAVLESVFGKSYMQMPPPEKRKTHYPVYVKFSDGSEMTFQKTENKLRIQDTLTD